MKQIIAIFLCLVLIFSFAGCGDKEAASDPDTKNLHIEAGVEISTEAFPEKTVLKVQEVKPEEVKYQTAKTALPKAIKLDAYEITAESEGVKVQPDGTVSVTFPIPESYDSTKHDIEVYFVADDGTTEKINASTTADGVVAKLSHFSTYVVILVEKKSAVSSDTASTSSETTTSFDTSSTIPVSSTPTPTSSKPNSNSNSNSSTIPSKPEVKVPKISEAQAKDMFSKFLSASLGAYSAIDSEYTDFYNQNLKNLHPLTATTFLYKYCKDGDLKKYISKDDEYKIVVPKSVLETISKRYLGYSYDFTKNYDIETFVITSEYDSKNKNVIITEMGGGRGGPDGFKMIDFTQSGDTLTLNLKYYSLVEEKPEGKEGEVWVDATPYGWEGAYYILSKPSTLTFKYVDGYWGITSFKAK